MTLCEEVSLSAWPQLVVKPWGKVMFKNHKRTGATTVSSKARVAVPVSRVTTVRRLWGPGNGTQEPKWQ